MTTTIQVRSDNPDDADLIARDIADHLAGTGFKRILVTTIEGGDALIKPDRQRELQSQQDSILEMTSNPSLLAVIRNDRPDFFANEEVEVMAIPMEYIEENGKRTPLTVSKLIDKNIGDLCDASQRLDQAIDVLWNAAEELRVVTEARGRPFAAEERLVPYRGTTIGGIC